MARLLRFGKSPWQREGVDGETLPPVEHSLAGDEATGVLPITRERSIVDTAVYVDGCRVASPASIAETVRTLRATDGGVAWLGLLRPSQQEVIQLAEAFELHELAVEDAIVAHQRPKAERYGDVLFIVLRAATYLDAEEAVEFGELHLFIGPNFVISVRHAESPDLKRVRHRMESDEGLLLKGPQAILYAIIDAVVDGYGPVVAGLDNDIDETESQVFAGDESVARRIYELSQETFEFLRAAQPLAGVIEALSKGRLKYGVDDELFTSLRDVADHLLVVNERVAGFRQALRDILAVNATLIAQRQNDEMRKLTEASIKQGEETKKISSWAAILFTPTVIAGIYGMNFDNMPELHNEFGYPIAVGLMLAAGIGLYAVFRRLKWL